MTYLQIKSSQCMRMFSQIYKRWWTTFQTYFQLYLQYFAKIILVLCLIVFNSLPIWAIIASFIAVDYLLIMIYSKSKVFLQKKK